MTLMQRITRALNVYLNAVDNSPTRSTYIFGQRQPTVQDARKSYTGKMRSYLEVAVQMGDKEAEAKILGLFKEDTADEEYLKGEAKK